MRFVCMRMKNHFHTKGWALNLVLIQRSGETRKWLTSSTALSCVKYDFALCTLPWVSRLLKIINLVHLSQFLFQGIFQEVGEFIIDSSGKQKLVLSNELIIWPDNSTAPSSEVRKCRSCKDRCYNGKKFSQQLKQSDFWTVYSIISWDIIQIKSYFVETVGGGGGVGVEIQEMIWNIPWYNMTKPYDKKFVIQLW